MEKIVFRQGCTYDPPIKITIDGKVPTEKDVGKINFRFGNLIKTFSDSGIPVIITTSDTNQDRVPDSEVDSGTLGTTTESTVFGIIADYNDNDNTKITVVGVGRGTSRVVDNSGSTPINPENS